ncbi:Hypothetical predicted protein [Cloeon dipterum]|uniref:Metalloendopeptidase n=1 Tax=Cloeon dipterum TaxID=197152 RepID=A0A8S1CHD9_9INSE|nr:Hypothetical predicted protein [Cloeon dipterum]
MLLLFCLFVGLLVRSSLAQGWLPPVHHGPYYPDDYDHHEVSSNLRNWHPYDVNHQWEMSGLKEGDIMESPEKGRNVIRSEEYSWPDAVIPYAIQAGLTQDERETIDMGMEWVMQKSCIRFRPYQDDDPDYIVIMYNDTGCWSYIGRQGGGQLVNLQRNGCIWPSTVAHELLHATGFYHQQNASDRDEYVNINWENIEDGEEDSFDKESSKVVTDFGVGYDYGSVMHYSRKAFSKNGEDTITPFEPGVEIGQRERVSSKDYKKLNRKYKCKRLNNH